MALIKCSECGKEFSDKANACPNCACPIEKKNNDAKNKRKKKENNNLKKKLTIVIGVVLLVLLVIIILILQNKPYYIGKWEHYVHWEGIAYSQRDSYAYYQFFNDNTFKYEGYTIGNEDDIYNIEGTYNEKNGILYLYYSIDGTPYSHSVNIEKNKLCEIGDEKCENYYIKSTSKENKKLNMNEREYLTEESYQEILKNKGDVIVVAFSQNCSYCNEYDDVLFKLYNKYKYTIYHYDIDMENASLKVDGTPTTFIIKDGKVVDKVNGLVSYEKLEERVYDGFFSTDNEDKNNNSNNSSGNNNTKPNNNNNTKPNNNTTKPNTNNSSQSSTNSDTGSNDTNNSNENTSGNVNKTPNYKIVSIEGIGNKFSDYGTVCSLDSFEAKASHYGNQTVRIDFTFKMTLLSKIYDYKTCNISVKAYDSTGLMIGSISAFISDLEIGEQGRKSKYFFPTTTDENITLKIVNN